MRNELPHLQNVLIIPNSTIFWTTYGGVTHFDMVWFDLMTRICLGSYLEDDDEVAKFRTRCGHSELSESNWLTSENFLESKYLGCLIDDGRRGRHRWRSDDSDEAVLEVMVPVFKHGQWMLEQVGKTSDFV